MSLHVRMRGTLKNPVNEAADSMRDAWEKRRSDIRGTGAHGYGWSENKWQQEAIRFVGELMPEEKPGTVLAVAKRLLEG